MVSSLLPLAYWSALGVLTGTLNVIWILLMAMLEWGTLTVVWLMGGPAFEYPMDALL